MLPVTAFSFHWVLGFWGSLFFFQFPRPVKQLSSFTLKPASHM